MPVWLILVPIGFALAAFGLAKSAIETEKKDGKKNATNRAKAHELDPGRNRRRPDREPSGRGQEHNRPRSVEDAVRVVNSDVARSDSPKPSVNRGHKPDAAKASGKAKPVGGADGQKAKRKGESRKPAKSEKSASGKAPEKGEA